jgi:hypothetical protein
MSKPRDNWRTGYGKPFIWRKANTTMEKNVNSVVE